MDSAAAPADLAAEIEIFRKDEEAAQQVLFAYLGIRAITAERLDVLKAVNRNRMFWVSSKESLLLARRRPFGKFKSRYFLQTRCLRP